MISWFLGITLFSVVGFVFHLGVRHISEIKASMNIVDFQFNRQDWVKQNRLHYGVFDREAAKRKYKIYAKTPDDLGL